MPQKSKKDHKCGHHTAAEGGSRWHNFHFSGKVIVCSVILGFMLVLVGGILFAIGQDQDEDTKPNQYDDVRKRPPMVYVGPVLMGIGVFIVIVGVLMCLFETNVCRKRTPDASPLINAEAGQVEVKDSDGSANGYDPIQSSPYKHKSGCRKKTPSSKKVKGSKKPYAKSENIQVAGTPAGTEQPKNFLTASDKFLTPPSSFQLRLPVGPENPSGKDSQVTKAMLQSLTSSGKSWTTSTEFQTPSASFVDDPMTLKFMENKKEAQSPADNHKFLSPRQSNDSILSDDSATLEEDDGLSKHEFLTPQPSNDSVLSEEPISNEPLDQPLDGNPKDQSIIQAEINPIEATPVHSEETKDETSGSEKKSEISSEKLDDAIHVNSQSQVSECATVSSESTDLLKSNSQKSNADTTPQDEEVGDDSVKEVCDEKTDLTGEKEATDLVQVAE